MGPRRRLPFAEALCATKMTIRNRILNFIRYRGIKFPELLEDPSELDWPDGWSAVHYDEIPKFTRELNRELCKGHILWERNA